MGKKKLDSKQTILRIRSEYKDRFCPGNPSLPSDVGQILSLLEARLLVVSLLLEVESAVFEKWLDKLVWSSDLSMGALDDARHEAGLPVPIFSHISACVDDPARSSGSRKTGGRS